MKALSCILFTVLAINISGAFELSENTEVIIGTNAPESTLLAAEEFIHYTEKAVGRTANLVRGRSQAASQVIIGTLDDVKNLPAPVAGKLAAARSPDAFAIVCCGETLFIVGKKRVGELYGTYAFLDEKVGIRWFRAATAKDDYEYIPHHTKLKFSDFEIVREPAFRYRQLSHVSATGKTPVNGQTAAVRQGFQINPPWNSKRAFKEKFYMARTSLDSIGEGGHSTFVKPVPQQLFDRHPEYFALLDGKRVKGPQICISNPEVQELVLQYVEDIYKEIPPREIHYLFGMIDTTSNWCECEQCRKLDETADKDFDYMNISTRFHKVATKLIARIYAKYPDAQLESWAYHTYRTIPKNVSYDHRTVIYYCTHGRCYGHELSDPACQRNAQQFKLMKEWKQIASRMRIYEYANCTPVMYGCLEDILAKDLRLFRKMGWEGWKEEMLFADAQFYPPAPQGQFDPRIDRANSNWQWYCVAGKLLWNPDLDPQKILEDVESKYYGKAYAPMKKYHDYRRKLWNNSSFCLGYPTGDQRRPQLLMVPGAKEKLLAYLDQADKLAGNDPVLKGRLQDDRNWLKNYWITPNNQLRDQNRSRREARAPLRAGAIKIDGNPSDSEWLRAWHSDNFQNTSKNKSAKPSRKIPSSTLSILADADNLYFRVLADKLPGSRLQGSCRKKDGNVFQDDHIEFFIMPPAGKKYYQIAVSVTGAVYDASWPGKRKDTDLNVAAAVKHTAQGFIMEVKVPLTGIKKALRGELWKIHAVRYIPSRYSRNSADGLFLSLDGIARHDTANYRGMAIESPVVRNGSFDTLNSKSLPAHWESSKCSVISSGASYAVKVPHAGHIYQLLAGGILRQQPFPRRIRVAFRASGKGRIAVSAHRYNDTPNAKAPHGYKRKNFPTETFFQAPLSTELQWYKCEYTIKANEWMALRFTAPGAQDSFAVIDDISISLLDK